MVEFKRHVFPAVLGLPLAFLAACGGGGGGGVDLDPVGSRLSVFGLNGRRPSNVHDRSDDLIELAGTAVRADQDAAGVTVDSGPASMSVYYGGVGYRGLNDDLDVIEEARDLMDVYAFGWAATGWAQHLDPTGGAEDRFEADIETSRDSAVYLTADGRLTLRNMDGTEGSGLSYATYGYWNAAFAPFDRLVAFTVADPNAGTTLPGAGIAVYRGGMTGLYSAGFGAASQSAAGDASLTVDFDDRTVSGQITGIATGAEMLRDVALQQTVLTGSAFSGPAATLPAAAGQTGPAMAGDYAGGLYGPMAPEAVGAFALAGTGGEALVGGFATQQ